MTHDEYIREPNGAETAVLCVHGILGTPRHFDMLLDLIPEEYAVRCIVLPGHGGEARDFSQSSLCLWEQKVRDSVDELRGKYKRLYLVGHSLGTLLLLDELRRSAEGIAGAFLMAVPLTPFVAPSAVRHSLPTAFGMKAKPGSELSHAWRCAYSVRPNMNLFRYATFLPRFIDLFRKIARVRRGFASLPEGVPIMAVQSYYDELVSRGSIRFLRRFPRIDTRVLSSSRHFYYPNGDLELLRGYFCELLSRGDTYTKEVIFCDKRKTGYRSEI